MEAELSSCGAPGSAEPGRGAAATATARARLVESVGGGARGGPLREAIVLDLTTNMAGPYCTMLLADLGATVLRVEPPAGEPHRWLDAAAGAAMGAPWALVNRDKASLALDLKSTAVQQTVLAPLLALADIVVHNFTPGVDARLGIDTESVRRFNPRAICCTISGFGALEGALAGVDIVAEAYSGVASVTGDDTAGPAKIGVPLFDVGAGLFATIEILARWVERTGSTIDPIDCTLVDAAVAFGTFNLAKAATGRRPGYRGQDHELVAPYGYFRTRDGWLALGCATDQHWQTLCRGIARQELADDARFRRNPDRMRSKSALRGELETTLAQRDALAWESTLAPAGVPCAAVRGYDEVVASDLLRRRGVLDAAVQEPLGDFLRLQPLSHSRTAPHRPARVLGADTDAVLAALRVPTAQGADR